MLRAVVALAAAARGALQRTPAAPCKHFIILKYAHTGSTWFVDELNGIDRFYIIEEFLMERFKESKELPTSAADIQQHFVEALTRPCEGDVRAIGLSQNPAHHTLTRPGLDWTPFDWRFLADLQRQHPFTVVLWYRSNVGLINEYRPEMKFCRKLKHPNSTKVLEILGNDKKLKDCRSSKFALDKTRFLRSITWGFCEIALYKKLADYISGNKTHPMSYEDFVRDEDGELSRMMKKKIMKELAPGRRGGRDALLKARTPSDIVKRSNSVAKRMVTNAKEVEGWFDEWGGPALLWNMFHDQNMSSFAEVGAQAACDHFSDLCKQNGMTTCLKLEQFTMGD